MLENSKKINKAFILSGGLGSRIKLGQKQNIKAFIEIENEQLLRRHIRLIKKNLNPEKIYVVITKFKSFFEECIKSFEGVELIFNDKISNQKGVELLSAIKKIDKIINPKENILLTLVDEYYEESDFKNFCSAISSKSFSTMVAIKKLGFPDEYFKKLCCRYR